MSEEKIYTCFVCLRGSTNSEKCTNCGAKIEQLDIENIVVTPPSRGHYLIPSEIFDSADVIAAVKEIRSKYFQNFEVIMESSTINVVSNRRAYDKFIEVIANKKGLPAAQVINAIPFIEKPDSKY